MPIIAVAVAAISVAGVGAAGFGAILAGTASIGTMFAGIAAVGSVLGAVGAVTGIKELQTAGMVIGGIGGVGALANAVGAFGEGATMGSVFGSSGAQVAETAVAPASALDTASLINDSGINSTVIDPITGAVSNSAISSNIIDTANQIGGFNMGDVIKNTGDNLSDVVKPESLMSGAPQAATSAADTAKAAGGVDGDLAMAGATPANSATTNAAGLVTGAPADSGSGSGLFSKGGFFSTSGGQMLGMGVIQAAGSFLQGAFDPLKPAQVDAYKAQAAANNASAALTNKQVSNMNEPIPVARRMAVTGKLGGMINSTPPAGAMA